MSKGRKDSKRWHLKGGEDHGIDIDEIYDTIKVNVHIYFDKISNML